MDNTAKAISEEYLSNLSNEEFTAQMAQNGVEFNELKKKHERIRARIDYNMNRNPNLNKLKGNKRELDKMGIEWAEFKKVNQMFCEEYDRRNFKWSDWWINNTREQE